LISWDRPAKAVSATNVKKGFLGIGGLELGAGQNAVELLPNGFSGRDGFWIGYRRL
jgi:hypothetical protein